VTLLSTKTLKEIPTVQFRSDTYHVFVFCCILFNDAACSSDYVTSNYSMILNEV